MFDIALPFRSKKFRAYTIVRFREDWEVWAVRTRVWTPRRYMEHWLSEADDPRRGSARFVVRSFSVSDLSDWSVRQKHLLGVMDAIDSDRGLAPW